MSNAVTDAERKNDRPLFLCRIFDLESAGRYHTEGVDSARVLRQRLRAELEAPMKAALSTCIVAVFAATATPVFAATCESLAALTLKDATVTRAEVMAPGSFSPPGGGRRGEGAATPYKDLPAFC